LRAVVLRGVVGGQMTHHFGINLAQRNLIHYYDGTDTDLTNPSHWCHHKAQELVGH
jgi:hypothetical protein